MRTKLRVMAATLLCGCMSASAQQFTIATLNVDGLPQKILTVKVNSDGPGGAGTARIGKYLMKKGYDMVLMQENFNYHDVLVAVMEDDYRFDKWSGGVGLEGYHIDFLHLQNHRFECDGLMACWKNGLTVTPAAHTPWQQNFGKFSHANDEMVTKGFRSYELTLEGGERIVVYNMHMDASDDCDEAVANDTKDREARMAQWTQLKDEVLQQLDSRPVVIVGDMNSLYGRDEVQQEFIEAINASGLGTASDVWVELCRQGVYPANLAESLASGETLDKVLYINPAMGTAIHPVDYSMDSEGYRYDGQPLGDHYPVAVTFTVVPDVTGISLTPDDAQAGEPVYYNLNGQRVMPGRGIYVEKNGKKVVKIANRKESMQ